MFWTDIQRKITYSELTTNIIDCGGKYYIECVLSQLQSTKRRHLTPFCSVTLSTYLLQQHINVKFLLLALCGLLSGGLSFYRIFYGDNGLY